MLDAASRLLIFKLVGSLFVRWLILDTGRKAITSPSLRVADAGDCSRGQTHMTAAVTADAQAARTATNPRHARAYYGLPASWRRLRETAEAVGPGWATVGIAFERRALMKTAYLKAASSIAPRLAPA